MNIRFAIRASLLALLLPLLASASEPGDPVDAVESATKQLLTKLDEVRPLYDSNREKFYTEVHSSLAPFIDFEGFARGVMAKYYRRASDEQQQEFAEKFQEQLVRTYASALVEFENEKIEVLPMRQPAEQGRATVELEIHGADGNVYPVTYTLAHVDGRWKLRNLIVEGINIGLQFRSQFSTFMQKYRGDIDQVIENWDVEVQST